MLHRLERSALAVAALVTTLLAGGTLAVAFAAPILDSTMREAGENPREVTDLAATGEAVYIREGCTNCHTQLVRPVSADADLGPVTEPGDTIYQVPHLFGVARIGPDLSCAAERFPEENRPELIRGFLVEPGALGTGSKMPSYAQLAEEDLDALTAYLLTRTCEGVEPPVAMPSPGETGAPTAGPLPTCAPTEPSGEPVEITVTADNSQFDTDRIEGPRECEPFTIVFENQEEPAHNIAIYVGESAGQAVFQGDTITGPDTITYEVPGLPAGEYYFQCDVHPTMNGTLVVGAAEGGEG